MNPRDMRIRISDDGSVAVIDPGFDALDLLQSIDPDFEIRQSVLPGYTYPRIALAKCLRCGFSDISQLSDDALWDIHEKLLVAIRDDRISCGSPSLLDVKIELAHRILSDCHLCAHSCGIDRTCGEKGICGLSTEATVANAFVHIAEEPPINPSLLVSMSGCGLRCRYCQQWELLDPAISGERLDASLWHRLPTDGARSLSFIGGNPDESLYAILEFLAAAPPDWSLPVVWNSHGYGSPEAVQLLDGVVDCYVPDFKYGSNECAIKLSGAPGYPEVAREAIHAMLAQRVPVIVRILVLPGHFRCCHRPILDTLASLNRENLYVSIRDQYWPDWQITEADGQLARRVAVEEVNQVHNLACKLGLKIIE